MQTPTSNHMPTSDRTPVETTPADVQRLILQFLTQLDSVAQAGVIELCTPGHGAGRLYRHMQRSLALATANQPQATTGTHAQHELA